MTNPYLIGGIVLILVGVFLIWHYFLRYVLWHFVGWWHRWRQRYECMGFSVITKPGPDGKLIRQTKDCERKKLKRSELHVINADMSDPDSLVDEGISMQGVESAIVRELCEDHCTGGCDQGCEAKDEAQAMPWTRGR